ncbi:MAG: hypothetical protein IJT30_12090 [Muribaculaceae bacterium]|nr:hypothetical protein [Muribaculaceae bacterium]
MTATELQERLERIVGKSTVLVEKYRQLRAKLQSAEERVAALERENEQLKAELERAQRESFYLRTARTLATTPEQVSDVRLMINRLVRDIDKCIKQLNTQ